MEASSNCCEWFLIIIFLGKALNMNESYDTSNYRQEEEIKFLRTLIYIFFSSLEYTPTIKT